jgi:hypothetical protein
MRSLVATIAFVVGLACLAPTVGAEPPPAREYMATRPSGFWTNPRPAIGGSYRYRLLGLGCAIALGMGIVILRVVRKANAERAARQDLPAPALAKKLSSPEG